MPHAAQHAFPLTEIAFVVVVAVLFGLGLMRLKQPPLVGFILAGVLMGPTGFGLISTNDNVTALAEMGVLMLLFFIGTELSLKAFVFSLKPAIIVTIGQLAAALAIGGLVAWASGAGWAEGIVLGFIIGLSSTVVAMKMLDDMGELRGDAGRIAVAVLIAQDLAVVPMLIFVSSLGGAEFSVVLTIVRIALAVGILAVLLWWLGRRGKIRVPFAEEIGDKVEILALGSLAVCFGAAALSGVAGLSPAYGAFVGGLIVGNSTLRSRVIPVIEPIESVLLVVFFLSIGLLIDLSFIWNNLLLVVVASLVVIAMKTVLNVFLLRATGHDPETALIGGLSMAQIGEFSFVLAAAGYTAGGLGYDSYRLAIAVTAVTLLLSPAWMGVMHRVENVASAGYQSYRAALSQAYAGELEDFSEGLTWLRARLRALDAAWRNSAAARMLSGRRDARSAAPEASSRGGDARDDQDRADGPTGS
ncbi:MAG: sodium:proton antiporter [Rhizobiales bacterium 65-79]|nr:MAG: sodium:proton antiporter [Rhizobiales bacterium 65-79]